MIALALLLAASPIYGTAFPDSFRQGEVQFYFTCLRAEYLPENGDWSGGDRTAPTIVQFGQLMRYCAPQRRRAGLALRIPIKARHPDWDDGRIGEAVEYVLSGMELERLNAARVQEHAVHDPPPVRF